MLGRIKICTRTIDIRVVLNDVYPALNINFDKTNQQIRCPFSAYHVREDVRPSSRIYFESNKVFCFVENKQRDTISVITDSYAVTTIKAVEFLEKRYLGGNSAKNIKDMSERKKAEEKDRVVSLPRAYYLNLSAKLGVAHTKVRKLYPQLDSVADYVIQVGDDKKFTDTREVDEWYKWATSVYKLEANKFKEIDNITEGDFNG